MKWWEVCYVVGGGLLSQNSYSLRCFLKCAKHVWTLYGKTFFFPTGLLPLSISSTEITCHLLQGLRKRERGIKARWCSNRNPMYDIRHHMPIMGQKTVTTNHDLNKSTQIDNIKHQNATQRNYMNSAPKYFQKSWSPPRPCSDLTPKNFLHNRPPSSMKC
jgi:hypothetical protein